MGHYLSEMTGADEPPTEEQKVTRAKWDAEDAERWAAGLPPYDNGFRMFDNSPLKAMPMDCPPPGAVAHAHNQWLDPNGAVVPPAPRTCTRRDCNCGEWRGKWA